MPETPFEHRQSAHCESGVTAALLSHGGVPISEAMAFGIGSGLFFIHLPMDRFLGGPTTSFRSLPGTIFTKACKRLGVTCQSRRYRDPARAEADLAAAVDEGRVVGLQTSVYWLSYMPRRFRFQFNAHNILVYGRSEGGWKVSDPVLDTPVECSQDSLGRARFAPGAFTPRGRMYYVAHAAAPTPERLRRAILLGARETAHRMSSIPVSLFGWKAIHLLAKRLEKWPLRFDDPQDALVQLATVVRMQEEIGTGGAGFRYLGAAFLQEAGERLEDSRWQAWSERLVAIGDRWRELAALSARIIKSGKAEPKAFHDAAEVLRECGTKERELFAEIAEHVRAQ